MFRKILVPLDSLRPDHPALYTARADFPGAELHLLHVIVPVTTVPLSSMGHFPPMDMRYELEQQAQATETLKTLGAGEVVVSPSPAAEILQRVQGGAFDLILMGTSTKGSLERLMLGSVVSEVVREAPVPVITVGDQPPLHAPRPPVRVLVLHDFSAPAEQARQVALAQFPDAEVHLLNVVPHGAIETANAISSGRRGVTANLLAQRRQVWVADSGQRLKELGGGELVEGDPAEVALERAASGEYDLIAMGTSSKGVLEHLFFGSVAQRVVRDSPIPVLTVRET